MNYYLHQKHTQQNEIMMSALVMTVDDVYDVYGSFESLMNLSFLQMSLRGLYKLVLHPRTL